MFEIISFCSFYSFVVDNKYSYDSEPTIRFVKVIKTEYSLDYFFLFSILFIRLPVPTLAETAKKYLKTVAPLLNNDEFNDTKKVCHRNFHVNNI